jgi:glycosyltransferase involved in cell wall biosynthesis
MRIGVFLPQPWRGGMLRAVQSFCAELIGAAEHLRPDFEVVLSVLPNIYSDREIMLAGPRLMLRETEWVEMTADELSLLGIGPQESEIPYVRPTDGGHDFLDCSLWVIFGAYFKPTGILAPLRPYYVYAPDFIQRYVPGIYGETIEAEGPGWALNTALLLTIRAAEKVLVTTPKTGEDAVGYAGAARAKVVLMPMWSMDLVAATSVDSPAQFKPYILWVSNPTPHKNHLRGIKALERYYEMGGNLDVVLVGPNTDRLSPAYHRVSREDTHPYWTKIAEQVAQSRFTRRKLKFLGEVSDESYVSLLSGARFVWHNVLYDNGSFVALEAARLGTPILSSDYPQMRYICEQFSIPATFFPPMEVDETAKALRAMERKTAEERPYVSYRMPDHWQQWKEQSFGALVTSCGNLPPPGRRSPRWAVQNEQGRRDWEAL